MCSLNFIIASLRVQFTVVLGVAAGQNRPKRLNNEDGGGDKLAGIGYLKP